MGKQRQTDGEPDMDAPGMGKKRGGMAKKTSKGSSGGHKEMKMNTLGHKPIATNSKHGHKAM